MMSIHRFWRKPLIVLCASLLLLPAWPGTRATEAGTLEVAPGYVFERLAPEGQYEFGSLGDADTDAEGNVYVAAGYDRQVVKLSGDGVILSSWESGEGGYQPRLVEASVTSAVYVSDNKSIAVLDWEDGSTVVSEFGRGTFGWLTGMAIDSASGTIYASDSDANNVWILDANGTIGEWSTYVDENDDAVPFQYPYGVAVDGSGNVYVLEDGYRILKLSPTGELIEQYKDNAYYSLAAIDVSPDGTIYATDNNKQIVLRWDDQGVTATSGGEGNKNLQFSSPSGIAVDRSGVVYVADTFNYRVQKLDGSLAHLATWGGSGGEAGQFFIPQGIAIGPSGEAYVADAGNNRVQLFDSLFRFNEERSVGSPYGLATDAAGNVFITGNYYNVYKFVAADGTAEQLPISFSEPRGVAVDDAGNVYVADYAGHEVVKILPDGSTDAWVGATEQFGYYFKPQGVAVDSARGIVYVSDATHIQTFDLDGTQLETAWGEPDNGGFSMIAGIALDSAGNLYVADNADNRIKKLSATDGSLLASWGGYGKEPGRTDGFGGIAVDRDGNVYVTDVYNDRIQKFAYSLNQLSGLVVTGGELDGTFDPKVGAYTVSVAASVPEITLTPEALHADAAIAVNGEAVDSGEASKPISVAADATANVTIEVTASDGQKRTYTLAVSRAPAVSADAALSVYTATFDKRPDSQADVSVTITLNGNTLRSIKYGSTTLASGLEYEVSGSTVKISKRYLATLPVGTAHLTFGFSGGADQTLAVAVSDTTDTTTTPSPSPSTAAPGNPDESRPINVITDEFNNTISLNVVRKRSADGKKTDVVTLDEQGIQSFARQAAAAGRRTARIVIDDLPRDPADVVMANLSRRAVSALDDFNIGLEIQTGETLISLSPETLALLKSQDKDITVQIVPIRSTQAAQETAGRVLNSPEVKEASPNGEAEVVGTSVDIETNYAGPATKVVFPLSNVKLPTDPLALQQFLGSLGVYVEHSDGEKALQRGTVVYDANGKPIGYEITISKFSTFTLVNLHDTLVYERYMAGSSDGKFHPERPVTRAELATMLGRLQGSSAPSKGTGFPDVPAGHWASDAIAFAQGEGIMNGDASGRFRPEAAVTRAEMATIISNWKKPQPAQAGAASFADTQGHWAGATIAAVKQAGWMLGYEDDTFGPDKSLTRAEAVRILNLLSERPTLQADVVKQPTWEDVPATHWAYADIESASRSFVERP